MQIVSKSNRDGARDGLLGRGTRERQQQWQLEQRQQREKAAKNERVRVRVRATVRGHERREREPESESSPSTATACLLPPGTMSVTLHTNLGDLKIEVFCSSVPKTAYNFLALCASGRYNGSPFHRNIADFMIQGGSPDQSGKGKGGASIYGDAFEDEFRPTLRHNARGIVSMANKGPATNGSQFFICYASAPHLDGKNTVFGKVLEGADSTLDDMEAVQVDKKSRPTSPIVIESVSVHANPVADE